MTPIKYDDPDNVHWDEPPATRTGRGSTAKFDRFCAELYSNPLTPALYRQGGNTYWSLSDSQRARHPQIKVENRKVEDGTISTWLTYDPDYVPTARRPKDASTD